MTKDILIVADLGAAGNLVRNLLLLGETHWPMGTNRFDTIMAQYPANLELKNWLGYESRLRFWKKYYGVDLSDHLDIAGYAKLDAVEKPRVWLNHSAFWQPEEMAWFVDRCDLIYVSPATDPGLEWQIRSYCEKKTVPALHDFSFPQDRKFNKTKFIEQHGADAYYRMNILNMKEIIGERQQGLRKKVSPERCIDLETLIDQPASDVCKIISNISGIELNVIQLEQVINSWRRLHWNDTTLWPYHEIFIHDQSTQH